MPNYNHFHVDCYLKVTCNILLIIIFTLKYSIDENLYLYLLLSRGRRMKSIILQSFSLYILNIVILLIIMIWNYFLNNTTDPTQSCIGVLTSLQKLEKVVSLFVERNVILNNWNQFKFKSKKWDIIGEGIIFLYFYLKASFH